MVERELNRLEEMLSTLIILLGNAKNEQCKMKEELSILNEKMEKLEKRCQTFK